jgi:23S rRNA (cytosine1962-C5)-methyltransferase
MTRSVREITLGRRAAGEAVAHGHPWVWRESIARGLDGASAGEEVQVTAPDGALLGRGLADPESPIAVRMWTRGSEPIDRRLLSARTERACALRRWLFEDGRTDAYRVVNGEGDRMPGLVVDRYASVAVARSDGAAIAKRIDELADALWPALQALGVGTLVHRTGARGQPPALELLRGDPPPSTIRVEEHGVPFLVDLEHGQKTGAFLDQRENRRRVGELAPGKRVLNLFSYSGGFSLHAALRGASLVTSVDVSAAAHATAQESFRGAGVNPGLYPFVTADVRQFLDAARAKKETWDVVISDPPSFAPNEKALPRALASYRGLHRACADVLAPGGILCAASCSSHVDAAAFLGTLDDASLDGRPLALVELRGAGPDHPTTAAFPEGRYLKFAVLA